MKTYTYIVDANGKLVDVDENWLSFSKENDAELSKIEILGKSLFEFISDPDTEILYREIIAKVKDTGKPISVDFRCDSPHLIRKMQLTISQLDDGNLLFESKEVMIAPRKLSTDLTALSSEKLEKVVMCSWCKSIRVDDVKNQWLDMDAGLNTLGILELPTSPIVSHSICPSCKEQVRRKVS